MLFFLLSFSVYLQVVRTTLGCNVGRCGEDPVGGSSALNGIELLLNPQPKKKNVSGLE